VAAGEGWSIEARPLARRPIRPYNRATAVTVLTAEVFLVFTPSATGMGHIMDYQRPIHVGAVNYLNTKPLIYRLERRSRPIRLTLDFPSRLADGLGDGRFDIALIPSVTWFRHPQYSVLSDACIACRGAVLSVKVFFRVPPPEVRCLAVDEGSRTSIVLAQVLLDRRVGVRPTLETLPIGRGLDHCRADAILLIGDRAIHAAPDVFHSVWDLGDTWWRWTGLPFVFAMWVAREVAGLEGVGELFSATRDEGVAAIERIAEAEAAAIDWSAAACAAYLRENLHFVLGKAEREGLARFRSEATRLGLVQREDPPAGTGDLVSNPMEMRRSWPPATR